ncbi:DNA repair exonuclease SbcCD ATPase subunit [Mucilaginibacter sp. SG538B]|uniref:coiled-coil domain-containing protein n=1 Tax=Mucilaginibacter sp. SG538B TaxID=2587021 RepID=UPI00159D6940|nr:hypothetical protein [Mucilaginibacter sp. SG538B]NVM64494.1 DNA repair exonuclease SbcCD ATPase subunit [Mucilaginibacter sp. SG538B]
MAKPSNEYLDEERKKLWQKLLAVEDELHERISQEVAKNASDYSSQAKQASKMASEYRNKSEISKNTILQYLVDTEEKHTQITVIANSVDDLNAQIAAKAKEAKDSIDSINKNYADIETRKSDIEENIQKLEDIFENFDDLTDSLSKLNEVLSDSEETASKIEALHKLLVSRKKDFDQLNYEVFGYKDSQEGKDTAIEGLKDKLAKAYDGLDQQITTSVNSINQVKSQTEKDYETLIENSKKSYDEYILEWGLKYEALEDKIQALLPNALTAGLSSAYSEKKQVELDEYKRLNIAFLISICCLVFISMIPFGVSYLSYTNNKPLDKVLLDMPRLVLSILPLYIPVLWVAYSSNRKMNLSKRLSEEYSHKEVLSKTFEGLSTQINNIANTKVSDDLKNKLLYNILEVSSENPGKLISDYNKADHPLMDALDKSVQLASAFEKLEKIPGFANLAKKLNKKSKAILDEEEEKANVGLNSIDDTNENT